MKTSDIEMVFYYKDTKKVTVFFKNFDIKHYKHYELCPMYVLNFIDKRFDSVTVGQYGEFIFK